jgi:choline-sulfatase
MTSKGPQGASTSRARLTRLLRTVFVVTVSGWIVGLFDAASIVHKGGSSALLPVTFGLLGAAALTGGVLAWIVAEVATQLGTLFARAVRARGIRAPDPLDWPVLVASLGLAVAVFPMHRIVERAIGSVRLTGFVLFPSIIGASTFGVARLIRRVYERNASRRVLVIALGCLAVAYGIHYANSQFFSGLYPEIHRPMTLAVFVVVVLGVMGLGASLPTRAVAVIVAVVQCAGMLFLPLSRHPARARAPIAFFGTELRHFHEAIEALLDHDGDGYSAYLEGGDCDDNDAESNPSRLELPDNGRDDNCIRGDMKRVPRPTLPQPPPDAKVLAWREAHPHPNVLLLFIDTMRADRLGMLGLHPGWTPNLDALAAKSVVFEQARTTAPRSPHALMALLRGRFNGRILRERGDIADPGEDTLVHRMKDLGYTTFARFVGSEWPLYHHASGWDRLRMTHDVYRVTGPAVTYDAKTWLGSVRQPFFMVLHYADPHAPYFPHDEHPTGPSMAERYDGEVAFTDSLLGQLLTSIENRGLLSDTVILAFGDHGENLGDHGDAGGNHGVSLFDEVLRVPVILYVPGATPSRVRTPVSLADMGPTLLDLVGGQALDDPDGCSLAGYSFGLESAPAYTISEFYDFGHSLRAIVKDRYKLVVDVRLNAWMLFDVLDDPRESRDLADVRPHVVDDLRDTLEEWVEERADTDIAPNRRCTSAREPR